MTNKGGYYNNGIFIPHYYRFYYGGGIGGFGSSFSEGGAPEPALAASPHPPSPAPIAPKTYASVSSSPWTAASSSHLLG